MASDCPVCGERLADGVLSRGDSTLEVDWMEEGSVPGATTARDDAPGELAPPG